jgi:hypothetical protein
LLFVGHLPTLPRRAREANITRDLKIADACRQLADLADLTSSSIRYQQMIAESEGP